jgi:hypothetical protein
MKLKQIVNQLFLQYKQLQIDESKFNVPEGYYLKYKQKSFIKRILDVPFERDYAIELYKEHKHLATLSFKRYNNGLYTEHIQGQRGLKKDMPNKWNET